MEVSGRYRICSEIINLIIELKFLPRKLRSTKSKIEILGKKIWAKIQIFVKFSKHRIFNVPLNIFLSIIKKSNARRFLHS